MVAPGRGFTHSFLFALKFLSGYEHRSTLPQSRIRSAAPSEREPGRAVPFNRVLAKIRRHGRFSSPLRNSKDLTFYHSSNDTPSVTPFGRDSSLREGAGMELYHSPGYSLKSNVTGDFHRPYETQKFLHFSIQRRTLPQSRPLGVTAPSEREPGWAAPFTRVLAKIQRYGRFSSPLRNSEVFTFHHSTKKPLDSGGNVC